MPAQTNASKTGFRKLLPGLLILWLSSSLCAQTPPDRSQKQSDVIRVFTELVQTDVMVFDKEGRAVNGLKREDFELKVDGKAKSIEFFEAITAGSDEEAQLAAARGLGTATKGNRTGPVPLDRGRYVLFFVDDLHMDLSGLDATRKLVNKFLDEEMGQNDEVAITSASGQIGFLQQLTDNKMVLRTALKRIQVRPYSVQDSDFPPMSEYQAIQIENRDVDLTGYFVDETVRRNPGMTPDMAANIVNNRARRILQQASHITVNTLAGLESLARRANNLPGRKLVFFISNGFLLDSRNSDSVDRVRRITSAAARNGVVIYSMDARGLISNLPDASNQSEFDFTGRAQRSKLGELTATQDGMHAIARDTGGRAVFNANDLKPGLVGALKETSFYYLLAWKPEREQPVSGRFRRIEVKIATRPDLIVRVRRGFFDIEPEPVVTKAEEKKKSPPKNASPTSVADKELHEALAAVYPERRLPVSLALTYLYTDKGAMLSASMEVPAEFLTFTLEDGKPKAILNILGSFHNDRGQKGDGFGGKIDVVAPAEGPSKAYGQDVGYSYPTRVDPGLYQVRVAARDQKSGLVGSKTEWIEIPDLKKGKLETSSLLLGERSESNLAPASTEAQNAADAVGLSISHRFHRDSHLRLLLFVYNAALSPADKKPDVAVQVQVVRDKQPVITTTLKKIPVDGVSDLSRLPYAAEFPLRELSVGSYRLQVTVIDRTSKLSVSQQTRFEIY